MSYTINTNINSLNAQRNAGMNSSSLATSMQRLSSGLRVNSAKDDAAGLAIATRMDSQYRGMNVAIRNSNDGISLAQTAEGGLSTLTDMVQRMRELAVQATNGTNTSSDLAALNQEYSQLSTEVQRTVSSVQFNGQSLLDASANFDFQVGANSGQTISVTSSNLSVTGTALSAVYGAAASALSTAVGTNSANATNIDSLDQALTAINTARANLGAVQSRFTNTINFLQSSAENQAAAKGRIMDADFAAETSNLSRAQVLQQAGTAMIAQAIVDIGIDRTQAGAAIDAERRIHRHVIDQVAQIGTGLQPRIAGALVGGLAEQPVRFHREIRQDPALQAGADTRADIEAGVHVELGAADAQGGRKGRPAQHGNIGIGLGRKCAEDQRRGGRNKQFFHFSPFAWPPCTRANADGCARSRYKRETAAELIAGNMR